MSGLDIETRGLDELIAHTRGIGGRIDEAAQFAVNDAARFARRVGSAQILDEINYPRSYLRGEKGRLSITKFAARDDLVAEVTGRDRPTSLAQFATGPKKFGRQRGVTVKVSKRGSGRRLASAFRIKLRRGKSFDGENFNVGLAVRVKPGDSLRNSTAAVSMGNGLYLLYGPSVDQAFQGVAADIVDEVSDKLETEYVRQFERLNDGR